MSSREQQAVEERALQPCSDNANDAFAAQTMARSGIVIQCHENEIPSFVGPALERLYGNLFSSLAYYRIFGGASNASTYIVRDGKDIVCAWLFRRHAHSVRVINEGIPVGQEEAARFAGFIFSSYPEVNVIYFHAVRPQIASLPLPHLRFNCLEDLVLNLPDSADAYLGSLGRSTRSYIHRYLNKLKRDFPSFSFKVLAADGLGEEQIRQIIRLNHQRMAAKGKESINDEEVTRRIVKLAGECGLVGVIMLGDRICAGSINYRVGSNYFLETLAHDPAYDDYRLGTLCCYLTICECIARGGNEYHFLWGQDEYKRRLLGERRDLDDLLIYRSYWRALMYGNIAAQLIVGEFMRSSRLWMREARRKDSLAGKLLNRIWRLAHTTRPVKS